MTTLGRDKTHINDLTVRCHNVQGMGDAGFRRYYLHQARMKFGVLGLIETKCKPADEGEWAKDFPGREKDFWASADRGTAAGGVALLFADNINASDLKLEYRDPHARILCVSGKIRGIRMVFTVIHAESFPELKTHNADYDQAAVYARAEQNIPILSGHEYIWLMDTNNCPTPTMDYDRVSGSGGPTPHPLGIAAMQQMIAKFEVHGKRGTQRRLQTN